MRRFLAHSAAWVCLLMATVTAASTSMAHASQVDQARELVSVLTSAAPGLLHREASEGSLSSFAAVQPHGLSSNANITDVELPEEATEAIPMGSAGVGLAPQPAEELGEAVQLQHNAVAFVGDNLTQVAVDRGPREYTLATIIDSPEAGESFTYDVHSADEVQIELGESGGNRCRSHLLRRVSYLSGRHPDLQEGA